MVQVGAELALVAGLALAKPPLALHVAAMEVPFVDPAAGEAEAALAVEKAVVEGAFVTVAVGGLPEALAMPAPVAERAFVEAATGIVDAPVALDQPVDQGAPVAPAIGQHAIGGQDRLALAAGGEQQGNGGKQEMAHGGSGLQAALSMPQSAGRASAMGDAQRMQSARVSAT